MADIFDTLNNYDRRLRQLETKPIKSPTAADDGVPAGGAQGEMLIKSSSIDYDTQWVEGIPTAGTTGQVLSKASGTNYDMQWIDGVPTGGTQGQVLTKSSATDYDMEWASPSTGTPSTITYVASSSASSAGTATTLAINMPTGVVEGDLVVLFAASENGSAAPVMSSSGWTTYTSATPGATEPTVARTLVYKFMGATPDTSASWSITGTNATATLAYAFRGVATPTGFSHPIKSFISATAISGLPNAPAITTTYANEPIFIIGALDDDNAITLTVPSGFTQMLSVGGGASTGNNVTVGGAIKTDASAGSTDPAAFGGSPGDDGWVAFSMTFWRENGVDATRKQIIVAASDETTALTTGTAKVTFRAPENMFLSSSYLPRASVTTAPTGATLSVDIEAGSFSAPNTTATIFTTNLTIDAGEFTSTTAATACVLSNTFIPDDAQIKIDIAQIGSTVAGAGLKVTLYYYIENS